MYSPTLTQTRTAPSIRGSPAARPSHSLCSASQRPSRAGRPGSAHSAALGSTAAPSESATQETICLRACQSQRQGTPAELAFQDIETDPSEFVCVGPSQMRTHPSTTQRRTDIRVVYLGQEPHLGRTHRVLLGQEQLQMEHTLWRHGVSSYRVQIATTVSLTLERTPIRPLNRHIEIPQVVLVRRGRDPWRRISHQSFGFL